MDVQSDPGPNLVLNTSLSSVFICVYIISSSQARALTIKGFFCPSNGAAPELSSNRIPQLRSGARKTHNDPKTIQKGRDIECMVRWWLM